MLPLCSLKKTIVWAPDVVWKHIVGNKFIKCTECQSAKHVSSHGWSPDPRKVQGVGETMWLISRRYRCNIGDCNHVFNAHDKKVMAQMPDFIQQLFPVAILNNKLAVHTDLQHLLRLLIIGGKVAIAKVQGVLSELEHMHSLHLEIAKASLNLHAKGAMDRFIQTPGRADSATAAEHDGAPPRCCCPCFCSDPRSFTTSAACFSYHS